MSDDSLLNVASRRVVFGDRLAFLVGEVRADCCETSLSESSSSFSSFKFVSIGFRTVCQAGLRDFPRSSFSIMRFLYNPGVSKHIR